MIQYTHKYYFGRVNIVDALDDDRTSFYLNSFSAPVHVEKRDFRYLIANEKLVQYEGDQFVYGELVKYKRELDTDVVDENEKRVVDGKLPYGLVAQSKFFIHLSSQIIAYHPISNRISNNQFITHVSELIELGYDKFFVQAKIEPIDEEVKIQEAIKVLKSVYEVSFDIHPTNPSNRAVYEDLDERLKRLNASREKRFIYSKPEGFNQGELLKDDAYKGIMLAVDGYGNASLSGQKNDETKTTITTGESPVTKEVSDSDEPKSILVQLFETFRKIWQRKNRNDKKTN